MKLNVLLLPGDGIGVEVSREAEKVLKHVARLWGFGVHLESVNSKSDVTKRWSVGAPQQ